MKTKPLFIGLAIGAVIGFFLAYLYFVSTSASAAGQKVFAILGGSAGFVAAICYFCRIYVDFRLGVESERLKIKFAKTYSLRADAIAEVHGKLLDVYETVNDFQFDKGGRDEPEKWNAAANRVNVARNNLIDALTRKQLYISKVTTKNIRDVFQRVYGSHLRYTMLTEYPATERGVEVRKWLEEKEQVQAALNQLEDEFRDALGFVD